MLSSIYLTGEAFEAQDLMQVGAPDWRSIALTKLERCGLKVINPLELAWSAANFDLEMVHNGEANESRVRRALDLIDQCDAVLANLNKSSYGTAMELFYAFRRGKMVTVVGPSPFNPWVVSHSQARFGDIDAALNYIIDEQPQSPPINWALQYEALLAERYEQFPPAGEPDYKFLGGELPILVIAPHATAFWREGEFHEADAFTGSMSALLNRIGKCHALIANYCCAADPCWYLETPMRRALADIVKTGQIGLVIFLLGAAWHAVPGLQIAAYGPASDRSDDYMIRLKNKLADFGAVVGSGFDHQIEPLTSFVADELAIPAVVLKMHKRYRMPRLQMKDFMQIANSLGHFIVETGSELSHPGDKS